MKNRQVYIIVIICFLIQINFTNAQKAKTNYQHYDMRHGLAQMKIHAIHEDRMGNMWIGTRNGLSKFNGAYFTNYYKENGLAGNRILDITSDTSDNLIIVTNNGISIFDGQNFDNILAPITVVSAKIDFFEQNSFYLIAGEAYHNYFINLEERSILEMDYQTLVKRIGIKKMQTSSYYLHRESLSPEDSTPILETFFLYNTRTIPLYKKEHENKTVYSYQQNKYNIRRLKINRFNHETILPSGAAKIIYDTIYGISKFGDPWKLKTPGHILDVLELSNGQMVIASKSGMFILSKPWFRDFKDSNLSSVWSIIESDNGDLYTNSWDEGIHHIDTNMIVRKIDSKNYFKLYRFLTNSVKDKKGNLYFPNDNCVLQKSKFSFDTIGSGHTYFTLHYDTTRDQIVGGVRDGIIIIKNKKSRFINFENRGIRPQEYFNSISQDKYNRYWMSSYSGLCCYNPDTKEIIKFSAAFTDITKTGTFGMLQNDTLLWIGLSDQLAVININTMTLERINSVIANSMIKGIITYNDSLLLVGAKNGLYLFNKKRYLEKSEVEFTELNKSHGYFGIEPGFDCFYRDSKARIWITSSNHLTVLTPRVDLLKKHKVTAFFTKLNNKKLAFKHTDQTYNTLNEINNITIEYEAIGKIRPDHIMFQYKLDDLAWSNWTVDKKIFLNNQKHGKHRISIRSGPTDLDPKYSQMDELFFSIHLPFYQRIWVQLLFSGLIIISLFYYLINYYRIRKKQQLFTEKIKENRYLKNQVLLSELNPHFIFNALSSIQSNVLKDNKIKASGQIVKLSKLIRAILNSSFKGNLSNVNRDTLEVTVEEEIKLIEYYLSFEKEKLGDKFDFDIIIEDGLDIENTYIPPMLLQPLVENAICHGVLPLKIRKGYIEITVQQKDDQLEIIVKDNGIGIAASLLENEKKIGKPSSLGTKIIAERINVLKELGHEIIMTYDSSDKGTISSLKFRNEY